MSERRAARPTGTRRRGTAVRDLVGTLAVLVVLFAATFFFILVEKFLENFKSH